jgi:hypothetical protein
MIVVAPADPIKFKEFILIVSVVEDRLEIYLGTYERLGVLSYDLSKLRE